MIQSRRMSMAETLTNVALGYAIAVLIQMLLFPLFGIDVDLGANLIIGAAFTAVSIGRSYALRRLFEHVRVRTSAR